MPLPSIPITRRDFLQVGTIPLLGLGLSTASSMPLVAREPNQAKSCILIWLDGGPSHLETFDQSPPHQWRCGALFNRLRRPCRISAERSHAEPSPNCT